MQRRTFNRLLASLTGLSLSSKREASTARNKPKGFAGFDSVQLAIATICTDGFANRQHAPAIEFIPQFGFVNVELNLLYSEHVTPGYVAKLKERCEIAKLKPISVQSVGIGVQGGKNGMVKEVSHKLMMMQHASNMGCRIVKFTAAKRGTQGGLKAVVDVCREIVSSAEQMGILIALENHVDNNLETLADYDTLFSTIDSPNVGLCLDTGHFEGAGIKLSEVLRRFHSRTLHVDLKDCRAFGEGHDTVVFGNGTTDFDKFLTQLLAFDYKGYLVVEQAWKEPKSNWKQDLKSAHAKFAKWCTKQ